VSGVVGWLFMVCYGGRGSLCVLSRRLSLFPGPNASPTTLFPALGNCFTSGRFSGHIIWPAALLLIPGIVMQAMGRAPVLVGLNHPPIILQLHDLHLSRLGVVYKKPMPASGRAGIQ